MDLAESYGNNDMFITTINVFPLNKLSDKGNKISSIEINL